MNTGKMYYREGVNLKELFSLSIKIVINPIGGKEPVYQEKEDERKGEQGCHFDVFFHDSWEERFD